MTQYLQAMTWLERGYPMTDALQPTLIALINENPQAAAPASKTASPATADCGMSASDSARTVVELQPRWGQAVSLPLSWSAVIEVMAI